VSQAVRLVRSESCRFAVKAGGHATFEGASNIPHGLTINLEKLNSVTLTNNGSIVQIGAGNRWYDVFRELEKSNVTVAGGRTGSVGVGGLTLGGKVSHFVYTLTTEFSWTGGLSFFSGHYGLVCDNVANYQV
jgi:FAD/FMN-containing dehydrogenase